MSDAGSSESTPKGEQRSYKGTLNLPKTSFSMKANLVQREPEFQRRWERMELYRRIQDTEHPAGPFLFHDGPPYANGAIHIGHLLNKVLKDLVVRSRTMAGHAVPYVPGWDCHGLPIEHKVMKDLGDKALGLGPAQIRKRCHDDAAKFVKLQSRQMQRLGTLGDYADPYLTMSPTYEAAVLEVFAELIAAGDGMVYRRKKPVHWSIANRTALAEAELEYRDREDTSVHVLLEVEDGRVLPAALGVPEDEAVHVMIWTTTPWTLPANRAVAVAPRAEYALYRIDRGGDRRLVLLAAELAERVVPLGGAVIVERLGECTGEELARTGARYHHPFLDQSGPIVTAEYVTLEDGTGLVHTAPGHGQEDYETGLREGLEVYCPVLADGTFDDTAPEWLHGLDVWEANPAVVARLRESGHLFHDAAFMHSYPHDWRSKTPVIFRATEQWFISVENRTRAGWSIRDKALAETAEHVRFVPEWGRNRMRGMLESRPDWCISRQRAWGLPIPAFYRPGEPDPLLTEASVRAVADAFRERGSDAWFREGPEQLLASYDPSSDAAAPAWLADADLASLEKSGDIFDVWFESGSSWHAVLRSRGLGYPADLYLEGSDQHRGWFQLSLLPALGATGSAPFRTVLTHGFMVDADGHKMSKSVGNALEVDELMKHFGADVCRWWVSDQVYTNDIKVDLKFFETAGEEYRKVRNTLRFLLSNLSDFDPSAHRRELGPQDAGSLDAWLRQELDRVIREVRAAYDEFAYRRAHEALFDFCNDTLSATYLAAVKDRLYCDRPDADRRRRAQTILHDVADALIRLLAPVLVHTAEEAYLALAGSDLKDEHTSVHLERFPEPRDVEPDPRWDELLELQRQAAKALEDGKAGLGLKDPMDAGVRMELDAATHERLAPYLGELGDLTGVSRFEVSAGTRHTIEIVDLRGEPRCERSWKRDGTVRERTDGGWLSDRDAEAVGVT